MYVPSINFLSSGWTVPFISKLAPAVMGIVVRESTTSLLSARYDIILIWHFFTCKQKYLYMVIVNYRWFKIFRFSVGTMKDLFRRFLTNWYYLLLLVFKELLSLSVLGLQDLLLLSTITSNVCYLLVFFI